jgi:hypothetical protein
MHRLRFVPGYRVIPLASVMTVLLLAVLFPFQQIVLRWPLDRCISKSIAEGSSASPYVTHLHRAYVFLELTKALGSVLLIKFQLLDFALQ